MRWSKKIGQELKVENKRKTVRHEKNKKKIQSGLQGEGGFGSAERTMHAERACTEV